MSLFVNTVYLIIGFLKYWKPIKDRYVLDIWVFSFISFYVTSFTLYYFMEFITSTSYLQALQNINNQMFEFIEIMNSTGITTLLVLLLTGFLSTIIYKILYSWAFSTTPTLDSEQRNLIFSRSIILNMVIYFSMGKLEFVFLLLVILAGRFIWIGTSYRNIVDELKWLKGDSQKKGDLESLAIFTGMFFAIGLVGAISALLR